MPALPPVDPPFACIQEASARYALPSGALRGILATEHGGQGVVHVNRDRSQDLGWMQINSKWLPYFAQYGITREVLLTESCLNIDVGAWILRHYYLQFNDWTRAIRAYNVGPVTVIHTERGFDYARKVIGTWRQVASADPTTVIENSPPKLPPHIIRTEPIQAEELPDVSPLSPGQAAPGPILIPN